MTRQKVCPSCGASESEKPFVGNFCIQCYLKLYTPVVVPEEFKVKLCPRCQALRLGRWVRDWSYEDVLKYLSSKVKIKLENSDVSGSIRENKLFLKISGFEQGQFVELEFQIPIVFVKEVCPSCSRKAGGYYEAVLQLRGKGVEEVLEKIEFLVSQAKGPMDFITKIERRKEGIDVYLGSRKLASRLISELSKDFKFKVRSSIKLHGVKNGKRVYRITYALRF